MPPKQPRPRANVRPSKTSSAKKPARPPMDPGRKKAVDELVAHLKRERARLGSKATFEERQDATFEIFRDAFWQVEDDELRESVTNAEEIEVDGKKLRRLTQASSATYFGRFGAHHVEEPLYREVGVRNGPTMKPMELKVGVVEHMTPDLARIIGALSADEASRELFRTLRTVGYTPPSRAFLADRVTALGETVADAAAELEDAVRASQELPTNVASVSCGLDRMAVRMGEPLEGEPPCSRDEPYVRKPPPQKEHCYRMAFVGSTSMYDAEGKELMTWRYATDAGAPVADLAARVAADVASVVASFPNAAVHCIQDAGKGLDILPSTLKCTLPDDVPVVELVDFEHLAGYLDAVAEACDPSGVHDMKAWYRTELLRDDGAIDRIQRNLREWAKRHPNDEAARKAIAAALSYIRTRKDKMRYATHHRQNLPIGSGATESTCWQMQQRVKLPGQSWEPRGLGGVLAIRGFVLSERWESAWNHLGDAHRAEVTICA